MDEFDIVNFDIESEITDLRHSLGTRASWYIWRCDILHIEGINQQWMCGGMNEDNE